MANRTGLGFLVLAGVSWGTSGTLGSLLVRESGLGFSAVAGYRILVGGLALVAFVLATRRFRAPKTRPGWVRLLIIAACLAIYQVFFFTAVSLTGVPIATLVTIGSTPLLVVMVDALRGHQRLTRRLALIMVLALAGLVLLIGAPPPDLAPGALLTGAALAVVAGASFAAIALVGARPEPDFHDGTGTGLAFLIGGSAVLVLASTQAPVTFAPTPASLALVTALGCISAALAYVAFLRGLRTQTATTASLVTLLEPITGTVLAAVVLGQHLTASGLVGAALLLGAVVLTSLPDRPST